MKELLPASETLPPLPAHLDDVCDRFEAACQGVRAGGPRPRLEDFLAGITGPELSTLRIELLALEKSYRRELGEATPLEEYLERFPQEAERLLQCSPANLPAESLAKSTVAELKRGPASAAPSRVLTPEPKRPGTPGPRHAMYPEQQWRDLLAPARQPDELGRLGPYRITDVPGVGGMGAVFKGRDDELGRDIAVKVMRTGSSDRAEFVRRFLVKAQIAGQLQHPGIAPVYELGECGEGRPYFTMKLVNGQTLSDLLKDRPRRQGDGPLPELPRFIGIFVQVCHTVAYAHARGVIHRDLKPGNIMVGAFGEVQVMDWGLAKVLAKSATDTPTQDAKDGLVIRTVRGDARATTLTHDVGHTEMGRVLGTLAYMPPEQACGEIQRLHERADVFALGAILCQILTGKPPYEGAILEKAQRADLTEAFARLGRCGADAKLIELAEHCLQRECQNRPRDARELANAVTAYQESVQTRLQQAEIGRAAAEARAEEEEKRRKAEHAVAEIDQQRREAEQAAEAAQQRRHQLYRYVQNADGSLEQTAKAARQRRDRRLNLAVVVALLLMVAAGIWTWCWYQSNQLDATIKRAKVLHD